MFGTGGSATAWRTALTSDDIPVDTPRVPAREAAEDELSKPMYHENDPNLLQRAMDRFWEWIGDLFNSVAGSGVTSPVGLAVIAVLVAALGTALWWRLGTPGRTTLPKDALFDSGPRGAAEHRANAEEHAAAERWNPAVQERMRAVVRSLEERTILDPRPGRTADEAAADAGRSLPEHATALRAAARAFDDITYGGRTADQQTYLRLRELDLALESSRPQLSDVTQGAAE
ncbi:membrane protein [Streptomyces camponoticapitis]|uniref:Membrane protein n=1 Tax=Streptomyces camponoticapitis TaxID=1616125 RepID=A0ABQ2EWM9_9ACTN|nr:membrane protein [Streptomyces camponoticapitis]